MSKENNQVNPNESLEQVNANPEANNEPKAEKSFSQEDLNKIVAKELNKAKAKWENEKKEAERLAAMSAEERAREEFENEKKAFEQEKAELNKLKLVTQTGKELQAKEIPSDFAEWLVGNDAESTYARIKQFDKLWKKAIDNAVTARLAGNAPKVKENDGEKNPSISKEQFQKLGMAERQKLLIQNPDLYKQLTQK